MFRGDFIGGEWTYHVAVPRFRDPLFRRIDVTNKVRAMLAEHRMNPQLIETARYRERTVGNIIGVTCEIPLTDAARAEVAAERWR